jgi:hypothetical protein
VRGSGFTKFRPPYVGEIVTFGGKRGVVTSVDVDDPTNLRDTGFTFEFEELPVTDRDYGLGPDYCGDRASFPLLRHIIDNLKPQGSAVEFGVADGTSLAIIAAHMPVVGFDWFQGLPEPWCEFPAGDRACEAPEVPGARIVAGLFADTLPEYDFSALAPIGLVHFDADLYSSTVTALAHVGPHLGAGCYVVFDEWHRAHPDNDSHEPRAWREYLETRPRLRWTVIGHDTEAWAIRLEETAP